jgi:hypothetical protein
MRKEWKEWWLSGGLIVAVTLSIFIGVVIGEKCNERFSDSEIMATFNDVHEVKQEVRDLWANSLPGLIKRRENINREIESLQRGLSNIDCKINKLRGVHEDEPCEGELYQDPGEIKWGRVR